MHHLSSVNHAASQETRLPLPLAVTRLPLPLPPRRSTIFPHTAATCSADGNLDSTCQSGATYGAPEFGRLPFVTKVSGTCRHRI